METYHLDELLHWGSTLNVLLGESNVLVLWLLGEINHVGGPEGLAVLLKVSLIGIHHAIEPWQQLLGAVVGVEDDWDAICWGDGTDVVSSGDASLDGGELVGVGNTLRVFQQF